jgi:hypothetical protein
MTPEAFALRSRALRLAAKLSVIVVDEKASVGETLLALGMLIVGLRIETGREDGQPLPLEDLLEIVAGGARGQTDLIEGIRRRSAEGTSALQ